MNVTVPPVRAVPLEADTLQQADQHRPEGNGARPSPLGLASAAVKITFHTAKGTDLGTGTVSSGAVPRAGDTYMNGSSELEVLGITWQFDDGELECFVTVKDRGSTTPLATYA